MAYDIQYITPQEAVRLTSVQAVPGVFPPVLQVQGEDFRAVTEVTINDVAAKQFFIVSPTMMFVTLPTLAIGVTIDSIKVYSTRLVITKQSVLRMKIPSKPGKVTGMTRLVQSFLRHLFTEPGSDIFEPDVGGNAQAIVQESFPAGKAGSIIAEFHICVDRTAKQLLAIQGRDSSLSLDEKLLSAAVGSTSLDNANNTLYIGLDIKNQAGKSATPMIQV